MFYKGMQFSNSTTLRQAPSVTFSFCHGLKPAGLAGSTTKNMLSISSSPTALVAPSTPV